MLSVIYVSSARQAFSAGELEDLAERAASANRACDITGLIACNTRSFMQLLEGPGSDVRATMQRIQHDGRHENIIFIRQQERPRRECTGWSMRSLPTPMRGLGSAARFTRTLPGEMDIDTQILFTSFASALNTSFTPEPI